MWAPADLFTHPFSILTLPLRRLLTYLYEHPLALGLLLAVAAGLIVAAETLASRRKGG